MYAKGECSLIGRTTVCGTVNSLFKSEYSPEAKKIKNLLYFIYFIITIFALLCFALLSLLNNKKTELIS